MAKAEPKLSVAAKTDKQIKNEIAVVRAFKKLGINATPHKDVMTFNRWVAAGYRPIEGTKAVKVGNLRLFHQSQVRKLTGEDRKALAKDTAKAKSAAPGKVVQMAASPQ